MSLAEVLEDLIAQDSITVFDKDGNTVNLPKKLFIDLVTTHNLSDKVLAKTLFEWRMANGGYYGSTAKRERDAFYWAEELANFLRVNTLTTETKEGN